MKRKIGVFILFILLIFLTACAASSGSKTEDFITTTYKILESSALIYSNAMSMSAILLTEGTINQHHKEDILRIGNKFWAAYQACTDALIAYRKISSAEHADKINIALSEVSKFVGELSEYIRPYIAKGDTI